MRHRARWLVVLILLAASAGAGWRLWPASADTEAPPPTRIVTRGSVEEVVSALGSVQPLRYVDVGAQVSGQLQTLHVAIGDKVERGQLLAEIDPTVYEARVNADRASIRNLQAQIDQKQTARRLLDRQLVRQKEMLAGRATSQDAFDSAAAAVEQNTAEVIALNALQQQAQSNLKGDEAGLRYTKINAPIGGTVVAINAREGQTLNASQSAPTIVRIADLETMTVWAQVSEADVPHLETGMPVYFTTLGRPDRRWTGTLRQVLPTPEVVNNVVLYDALFDVGNADRTLLPQMSAQVFFVVRRADDVPTLPMAALRGLSGDERTATAEVLQNGKPAERTVEIGIHNRTTAEIRSGLDPGDEVIMPEGTPSSPRRQAWLFRFKFPHL